MLVMRRIYLLADDRMLPLFGVVYYIRFLLFLSGLLMIQQNK